MIIYQYKSELMNWMGSQECRQTTSIGRMLRYSVTRLDWFKFKYVQD
jgi:hypothetical protein